MNKENPAERAKHSWSPCMCDVETLNFNKKGINAKKTVYFLDVPYC